MQTILRCSAHPLVAQSLPTNTTLFATLFTHRRTKQQKSQEEELQRKNHVKEKIRQDHKKRIKYSRVAYLDKAATQLHNIAKESIGYDPILLHSPPFNPFTPPQPPGGGGDFSPDKHTPTNSPVPPSSNNNNNLPYEPKTEYEKVQRKISSLYEVRTPGPTTKKVRMDKHTARQKSQTFLTQSSLFGTRAIIPFPRLASQLAGTLRSIHRHCRKLSSSQGWAITCQLKPE